MNKSSLIARAFNRAATTYDQVARLQRCVGDELLNRLDFLKSTPSLVLDLGCGTGYATRALHKRYHVVTLGIDIAFAMTQQAKQKKGWFSKQRFLCADAIMLPLADQSVDMVLSNLALQWCQDLPAVLREIHRVMRPGGLFLFSSFGPDTLRELRQSWAEVDDRAHVQSFIDMHDIGDNLLRAHFRNPVMEREDMTLYYDDIKTLAHELKHIGSRSHHEDTRKTLTGKQRWRRFQQAYQTRQTRDHKLPATYEVIYGHAWADAPRLSTPNVAYVPISQLKRSTH